MARRKNVKRIDPRYFLNETVNRNDDGSALEEGLRGKLEPAFVEWAKKNPKAAKALEFIGLPLDQGLADAIEFVFLGPDWGPRGGPPPHGGLGSSKKDEEG